MLFVLILIVMDQVVGTIISTLAKKQARDNRIGLLLDEQINSEVVIIGSSRALNNYSPSIITKKSGLSCYNLGVSGSNILFHETILDLVLSSKIKPKVIIYNIDDYGAFFNVEGIIYRKDVLFPYVENPIINRELCEQLDKKYYATYVSKTYQQNINFINAVKYLVYGREAADYKTTNFDDFGSNLLVQRPEDHIPVFLETERKVTDFTTDSSLVGAFKRIQDKCKLNNIKLIMCLPPLYAKKTFGFKNLVEHYIIKETTLIDFSDLKAEQTWFFNSDHMNIQGAEKYSELVSFELKKVIQ